jgi:hypothetical protein
MPLGLIVPAWVVAGILIFCCWRLIVGAVAARPVSDRLREAAGLSGPRGADFSFLETLATAAGALADAGPRRGTTLVRLYYRAVRAIGGHLPFLGSWSEGEMTVCARYLAVQIDRCLASNADCSRLPTLF